MISTELIEAWKLEELQPFIGWDFSHRDGRMLEEQPTWSYTSRSAELMRRSSALLDLGTGGAERLLKLRIHQPTEEYPPNFRLATRHLSPFHGPVLDVHLTGTAPMPFADGEFDLVLDRHSAFNPREVTRILAPLAPFSPSKCMACGRKIS